MRATTIDGQGDEKSTTLTRDGVAKRLGISVSSVRRLEGEKLHPMVTEKNVRRFKIADVEQFAASLVANNNKPRNAAKVAARVATPEVPKGELAALAFERFEQRHSLAEIVIALRVTPEEVRELYHSWLVGLWEGELQRKEPALPNTEQDAIRKVTMHQLAQMLVSLPKDRSTRISIARAMGDFFIQDEKNAQSYDEYRNLTELGGFVASGPIAISEITNRVGAGEFRISAYSLDAPGLRWEVFVCLGEDVA